MKSPYHRLSPQNAELYTLWEIYNKLSESSFMKPDQQSVASPVPFQPILNTPGSNHRTTSRTPFSDINADIPTFWPSPSLIPSSLPTANQPISSEEYKDFLRACHYSGSMREYWEIVAEQTSQIVFECAWEGCLMFVLHRPVPSGIASEVIAHLSDHCWRSGHCLWLAGVQGTATCSGREYV